MKRAATGAFLQTAAAANLSDTYRVHASVLTRLDPLYIQMAGIWIAFLPDGIRQAAEFKIKVAHITAHITSGTNLFSALEVD